MSSDPRLVVRGADERVVQHLKMLAIRDGISLSELVNRVLQAHVTANPIAPPSTTKA